MPVKDFPSRGFTLIEAMITLVIGGILLSLALPSFLDSVRRGRRSDAADAAVGVLQAQERWRGGHASYSDSLASLNQAVTSANGYYGLALSVVSGTGYTLTLSGVGGKGQDADSGCATLVVAVVNGSPAYTPPTCWSR